MRYWFVLFLQALSAGPNSFIFAFLLPSPSQQQNSRPQLLRVLPKGISKLGLVRNNYHNGNNNVAILSATRERRTTNSGSSSSVQEQQQQLISDEETARQKRLGQAKRRREKLARMENRVSYLESLPINECSAAEQKELEGLLKTRENFEEQYDPTTFSTAHLEFKRKHNEAFAALARYCQRDRLLRSNTSNNAEDKDGEGGDPKVFYLDGPDCATSLALFRSGFDPSSCYVANRHLSTCEILQTKLPKENVLHCTAAEALTPHGNDDSDHVIRSFADVDFSAYYFDGCGGFVPHVIGMMTAALIRTEASSSSKTTAVGFSLMGGNRDVIEKELEICRALAVIACAKGMRTRHVLDDPQRFGIPKGISKTEGGTFTSWILLEEGD